MVPDYRFRRGFFFLSIVVLFLPAAAEIASGGLVAGVIYDAETGEPVPYATVRVEGSGQSMAGNDDGEYRLILRAGRQSLKFSHVSYYSERVEVQSADSAVVLDIHLKPATIVVPGIRVSANRYGPGERIILAAISRKAEILAKIRSYSFEAYTKMAVRKEGPDDSTNIFLITETQHEAYWEHPDNFKEIVTAQRQTANLKDAPMYQFTTTEGLLNFNDNRIEIFGEKVVSPTAEDALDYYCYDLIDTLFIDGNRVFLLELEPKSRTTPLLAGDIMIADSTYDAVGLDVRPNEAFSLPLMKNVRFVQKGGIFEGEFWMPVEMRVEFDFHFSWPGLPSPLFIDWVAVLHQYNFNIDHPKGTFGEYVFEVVKEVFDRDSAYWQSSHVIPLTAIEIGAYSLIDSVANAPKPLWRKTLGLAAHGMLITMVYPEFFHFNRVEGTYLGLARGFDKVIPKTVLRLESGYAIAGEYWQHDYRITSTLSDRHRLSLSIGYHDKITRRPTVISGQYVNPTISAATNKTDQFDYFLEKGFVAGLSVKTLNQTRLGVIYHDCNQYSVSNQTEFGLFRRSKKHRLNPGIADGKLRAVSATFKYDSRKLRKDRGREQREWTESWASFGAGIEYASPEFVNNDFDYSKYYADLYLSRRFAGFGLTRLRLYTGSSSGVLPPQREFTIDFGHGLLSSDMSFKTLGETNFSGDRAAAAYLFHDFGRLPFMKSNIPLIRDIPFSLGVFAGLFWTEFENSRYDLSRQTSLFARKIYSEIGFEIGRISPFGFKFAFVWQLSDYPSDCPVDRPLDFAPQRFTWSLGMEMFQF